MYQIGTYITDPVGNNEFHYDERIALGSQGKIFIPNLITGSIDDLEEGSEIVFEEVENGKLVSCIGLKHFIETSLFAKEGEGDSKKIPVYIIDNHNHALTFWYKHNTTTGNLKPETFNLVHIDQHADIKPNNNTCPPLLKEGAPFRVEDFETFINTQTNVGNFISAALNNGIINEVIQIRTDYALHNLKPSTFNLPTGQAGLQPFILDIDVDFWEDKSPQEMESDFEIIRNLVDNACLITIATSPYFIDQKKAIEIVKQLLQ